MQPCTASTLNCLSCPPAGLATTTTRTVSAWPPAAAMTCPVPGATPVTRPSPETRAIDGSSAAHTTVPATGRPRESVSVEVSRTVSPTWTVGAAGVTDSSSTGAEGAVALSQAAAAASRASRTMRFMSTTGAG